MVMTLNPRTWVPRRENEETQLMGIFQDNLGVTEGTRRSEEGVTKVLNIQMLHHQVPPAPWGAEPQPQLWLWMPYRGSFIDRLLESFPPASFHDSIHVVLCFVSDERSFIYPLSKAIITTHYNAIQTKSSGLNNKIKISLFSSKAIKGGEIGGS